MADAFWAEKDGARMTQMVSQEEYQRLVRLTEDLYRRNVSESQGASPRDFADELVRQILSTADQSAKQARRGQQAEGIARAKAQGVRFGRPEAPVPPGFPAVVEAWQRKDITFQQALDKTGLSESTFYRRLRLYRSQKNGG